MDQELPNEDDGEERGPGPVSCGWCWKLNPGRIGDSIGPRSLLLLSAEAAWLLPFDGLSDSEEEVLGSDDGVGVEGGGSTCVGSC